MTADQAIKILRGGADGMGNEGPEYEQCAELIERLTKALLDIRNDALASLYDRGMLMTLRPQNALANRILYQHLADDRFADKLPESEGQSSEAITSTETSAPKRFSGG